MLKVHTAPTSKSNPTLKRLDRGSRTGNKAWLEAPLKNRPANSGSIVLVGGANLTHFRMRVAQSHVRRDLLPSFWSHAAILTSSSKVVLHEVSLEPPVGFLGVPRWQGIQASSLAAYDDPEAFPNVALIQFRLKEGTLKRSFDDTIGDVITRLYKDRGTVDIPSALWAWLGYVWGISDQINPLLRGVGIPAAIFVETVFSMIGIEVSPGLASQSSCPEAIWQAAKWWGEFYQSEATLTDGPPSGFYHIGQPSAAITNEDAGETPTSKGSGKTRGKNGR